MATGSYSMDESEGVRDETGPVMPGLHPDPCCYFEPPSHAGLWASVRDSLASGSGVVVVTGDSGTGKSLFLLKIRQEVAGAMEGVVIDTPTHHPDRFVRLLVEGLDPEFAVAGSRNLPTQQDFLRILEDRARRRQRVLIAVDDAHFLSGSNLEVLIKAVRCVTSGFKPVLLLLAGRPELQEFMSSHAFQPLLAAMTGSGETTALRFGEVRKYIGFFLSLTNRRQARISLGGWLEIALFSRGVPQQINRVLRQVLGQAPDEDGFVITNGMVRRTLAEAGQRGYPLGMWRHLPWVVAALIVLPASGYLLGNALTHWSTSQPSGPAKVAPDVERETRHQAGIPATGDPEKQPIGGHEPPTGLTNRPTGGNGSATRDPWPVETTDPPRLAPVVDAHLRPTGGEIHPKIALPNQGGVGPPGVKPPAKEPPPAGGIIPLERFSPPASAFDRGTESPDGTASGREGEVPTPPPLPVAGGLDGLSGKVIQEGGIIRPVREEVMEEETAPVPSGASPATTPPPAPPMVAAPSPPPVTVAPPAPPPPPVTVAPPITPPPVTATPSASPPPAVAMPPAVPTPPASTLPEKPAVPPETVAKTLLRGTTTLSGEGAGPAVEAPGKPQTETPGGHQPAPYVLQIGSYVSRENAERVNKRMVERGFPAYLIQSNRNDQVFYSVRVGFETAEQARQLGNELEKQERFSTMVIKNREVAGKTGSEVEGSPEEGRRPARERPASGSTAPGKPAKPTDAPSRPGPEADPDFVRGSVTGW